MRFNSESRGMIHGRMHAPTLYVHQKSKKYFLFGRESLKSADVPFHDLFQKLNVDRVAEDFQECAEIRYAFYRVIEQFICRNMFALVEQTSFF